MALGDDEQGGSSTEPATSNPWVKAGAAAALGFEFVGLVLAGVFVGVQIDARFDSSPIGLLVCLMLAMVAAGWHIYLVTRRYVLNGND